MGVGSGLGWRAGVLSGILSSFFFGGGGVGGPLFPLSSLFSLGFSNSFVVQAPSVSLIFAGVSFLSLPVFADSSGWLAYRPWLSALCCLATGGVTLFFCQGPVGLPCWDCGASGFLGPAGFRVFAMGVTCLRPGLCSSSVRDRKEDFPSFWWVWFLAFVLGFPLSGRKCSSACDRTGDYPSLGRVWFCA